jgi:hypothetical protein
MEDDLGIDQEEISGGLPEATEAELVAQDAADQEDRGASLTEPDEEGDFLTQEFEYVAPDGSTIKLTGQDLLDSRERASELEARVKELESKPAEKPAEVQTQVPEGGEVFEPVQWEVVGDNFQAMLEGEQGGSAAIGPALHDVVLRTIATDPIIADVVGRYIDFRVSQREEGAKVETSFKEFVGGEIPDTELKEFMQANPWARNRETAMLGVQKARLEKQIADLKSGKEVAHKEGLKKGEKEALIRAKARGTLRPLTGAKGGRLGEPGKTKYDIKDTEQRSSAMAEFIMARRASGKN